MTPALTVIARTGRKENRSRYISRTENESEFIEWQNVQTWRSSNASEDDAKVVLGLWECWVRQNVTR